MTKHRISIAQRVDRICLISVCDQNRQVLMANTELFGAVVDQHKQEPVTSPTLKNALHSMAAIAELYAEDTIKEEDLKEYRNNKLSEEGWTEG